MAKFNDWDAVKMVEGGEAGMNKGKVYVSKSGPKEANKLPFDDIWSMFAGSADKFGSSPALGHRPNNADVPYAWETYSTLKTEALAIGAALKSFGMAKGQTVGVLSPNCPEWMKFLLGGASQGMVNVPLYDTLGANAIEYIIDHAETSVVVVNAADKQVKAFVEAVPQIKTKLLAVVLIGKGAAEAKAKVEAACGSTKVVTFAECLEAGKGSTAVDLPATGDNAVIMYTSGTTGNPKGVQIAHESYMYIVGGALRFLTNLNGSVVMNADDVYLSFLPLAHIFDQVVELEMLSVGARIGYWRGDVKGLLDDVGALKPTVFCGVPRIYDKIYSAVMAKATGLKKKLLLWAINRKLHFMKQGSAFNKATPLLDFLLLGKVKAKLGGRVKIVISGAAPLAPHVEDFLRATMCCPVIQGYGLTETCAVSCVAIPDYPKAQMASTVGVIQPVMEMSLDAVDDMGYSPKNDPPAGEICLRGPGLFKGYYKQDELTAEVMDADGWFHTGDVGTVTPAGALKIIDRKKNFFKLSQGEYVAVEKLEAAYELCAEVDAIWVYGNSFESTLVCVCIPNEAKANEWAKEFRSGASIAEICADERYVAHVLAALTATGKQQLLKGFEMVKAVHMDPEPWSPEVGDVLTPTFKKKRPQLLKFYKEQVDAMYAKINAK